MRKLILTAIVCCVAVVLWVLFLSSLPSCHAADICSFEIDAIERGLSGRGLRNCTGIEAERLEQQYGIQWRKNGEWNCQDRAEVAIRELRKLGYIASPVVKFGKNGTSHMYVRIYEDKTLKNSRTMFEGW